MQALSLISSTTATLPFRANLQAAQPDGDTYVEGADTYFRSPVSTETMKSRLDHVARANHGTLWSPVAMTESNGNVELVKPSQIEGLPEDKKVFPLRLGALRHSLREIGEGDPWLLDRDPVFYMDKEGKAHIDYTNLAGFVIDPIGTIVSRSVNPW